MADEQTIGTLRVTALLEELEIDYVIVGSLTRSIYGTHRSTLDTDIVADIRPDHVSGPLNRLLLEFDVSPEAA